MAGATARLEGQGHKSGLDPVTGAETRLELKFAHKMVTVKNGILYLEFFLGRSISNLFKDKLILDQFFGGNGNFREQIFFWQFDFSLCYRLPPVLNKFSSGNISLLIINPEVLTYLGQG